MLDVSDEELSRRHRLHSPSLKGPDGVVHIRNFQELRTVCEWAARQNTWEAEELPLSWEAVTCLACLSSSAARRT